MCTIREHKDVAMNRRQHEAAQAFDEAWEARARNPRTSFDDEVAQLVACAEQLCEAAVVEPSAEFRSSLRVQLMAEARTTFAPPSRRHARTHRPSLLTPSFGLRRRLAGATAALVTAGGFVGLVGASAEALPGEMLYPVKRGVENVELAFHKDDVSRGQYRLSQASERLAEARRLTDDSSPQSQEHIAGTLSAFADQAKDGSGALFRAYGHSGSTESITAVNDFSASAATDLALLSSKVPSDADEAFQAAALTVSELVTKASSLCAACGSADVGKLVDAVTSLGGSTPSSGPSTASTSANADDARTDDSAEKSKTPDVPKITIPALQPPSSSAPSSNPPKVKDLTDPVVGGLLGDEEQEGVVPDLLDNLLDPGAE
jgi:hypothetical protein